MALVHTDSGFFCAEGEQLAAPGLAIEQLAQEVGDFTLTGARIEQSPACARLKRDEPESAAALTSFRHVWRVWVEPTSFDACKSHVCILRVNRPQEDTVLPKGSMVP